MLALCMNRRTRIVNQLRMVSGWKFLLKSSEITSNLYLKYTQRKDLAPLFSTYQIQYHAESIQEPLIEKEMTKDPHLLKFWRFITHYYKIGLLSRFQTAFCPGFGTGTKASRLLSRVAESWQKVPDVKIFRHTTGFDLKTFCLAHGFLTNSPK